MKPSPWFLIVVAFLAAGCPSDPAPRASSGSAQAAPTPESAGKAAAEITKSPSTRAVSAASSASWNMIDKVTKTEDQWRTQLGSESFRVLRKHGTERAFTGALWDNHEKGVYRCAGCGLELFHSDTKFDSGTGWPSYFKPLDDRHVGTTVDRSFFSTRTEVHCARCDGHLGHVFDDGPAPTGLRYCINSVSLTFEKTTVQPAK